MSHIQKKRSGEELKQGTSVVDSLGAELCSDVGPAVQRQHFPTLRPLPWVVPHVPSLSALTPSLLLCLFLLPLVEGTECPVLPVTQSIPIPLMSPWPWTAHPWSFLRAIVLVREVYPRTVILDTGASLAGSYLILYFPSRT